MDELIQQFLQNLQDNIPTGRLMFFGALIVLYVTRHYWLAPILFYNNTPIPPSKVEPVASEQNVPEPVRKHFAQQGAALAKLGFVARAPIREHNGTGNVMYHQYHSHAATGDAAVVGTFVTEKDPKPRSFTLAMVARLADGTEVQTLTDTVGVRAAPRERERRIIFWMGDAVKYKAMPDDVARVHRVHRALVRRSGTQKPLPVDDPISHQVRAAAGWRRRMLDSGWYYTQADGALRPTIKGACFSMWLHAWPWRSLRRRGERRRMEALLKYAKDHPEQGSLAA